MEENNSEIIKSKNLTLNEYSNRNYSSLQEGVDLSQNHNIMEFKIILIGNTAVGKTSIFNKFITGDFLENLKPTINVEFRTKYVKIDNNLFVKLVLWDTCGVEMFRAVTKQYYKGAQAIILVFDLTDQKSFNDLKKIWLKDVKSYADKNIQIVIVGNKLDLIEQRKINESQTINFCRENGYKYIEASAKEGTNILKIFEELSFDLAKNYENSKEMPSQYLMEFDDKNIIIAKKKKHGCC